MNARSVVLTLALSGCTGPATDGLLEQNPASEHRFAGYVHQPDGVHEGMSRSEPEPEPKPKPVTRPLQTAKPRVELVIDQPEPDDDLQDLVFSVSARDVPAIDVDDGTVVIPEREILQGTIRNSGFEMVWLSEDEPETSLVAGAGEWPTQRELKSRVGEINRRLRERSWRKMEPLPVQYMSSDDTPEYHKERLEPHERPVQVLLRREELIVRILGVRVLERHDIGPTRGEIHSLYADRDSGVAVAVFTWCAGEDCTCDPVFTVARLQLDPATLQVIDRHPCVESCGPTDYGYAGIEPWG